MVALLLLSGCMGPSDETFIGELRVVAMASDPPAVEAATAFELTVTVADPLGEGGELLVWSCLPEELAATAPQRCVSRVLDLDREQLSLDWFATAPLPLWAMACAPGLCGDLSTVTEERLTDPITWLQGLPVSGVSAGFRLTPIALPDAAPAVNPELVVVPPDGPIPFDSVDGTSLGFVAKGADAAFGYATAGGFRAPRYDVAADGAVDLEWIGDPTAAGPARLYVVFEDGQGGVTVWIGEGAAPR